MGSYFHEYTPFLSANQLAFEAPLSPHDCFYRLVGYKLKLRVRNQFDALSPSIVLIRYEYHQGTNHQTPATNK
jgi:hypothetical protein